jgi:ATP-dependent RNA helicase DDX46/PRP5
MGDRSGKKSETAVAKVYDLGIIYADEGGAAGLLETEDTTNAAEEKKVRRLEPVDHSKIDYMTFRKNLYILPRALAKLTQEEIAELRTKLTIKVRGKGCPPPITAWDQCGLSERTLSLLGKHGLEAPFAIQKQAIPAIMGGRDVIGVAKTGSGKTLAFILPMLRHIQDQPPRRDGDGPIGLIMAPARELAYQIRNEARKFTKSLGLSVVCCYGGAGIGAQISELKRGAEMVVCTPGRMIDLLSLQNGNIVNLLRVTMVVMDEADRMFDMGFEPQIRMIMDNVRPDRQTVLFSATFPKQIEKLARAVLKYPLEIQVGNRIGVNSDITQVVEVHEDSQKYLRLLQLLGIWYERGNVLIFVDTQDKCDDLFKELLTAGYACVSLHGGKEQIDRDHVLTEFKQLIKPVMVATGVAGRGLDVPEIVCVVNYHCPDHMEDYIHRVGRTGRAGRKGVAYTFISQAEAQFSGMCIDVLEALDEEPSESLKQLHDAYVASVEAKGGGKSNSNNKHNKGVNGFSGKGFKFDGTEMSVTQRMMHEQQKLYAAETGEKVSGLLAAASDPAEILGGGEEGEEEGTRMMMTMMDSAHGGGRAGGQQDGISPLAEALERARTVMRTQLGHLQLPPPSVLDQSPLAAIPISAPCITATGSIDSHRAKHVAAAIGANLTQLRATGTVRILFSLSFLLSLSLCLSLSVSLSPSLSVSLLSTRCSLLAFPHTASRLTIIPISLNQSPMLPFRYCLVVIAVRLVVVSAVLLTTRR